jgi:hypothetical protein
MAGKETFINPDASPPIQTTKIEPRPMQAISVGDGVETQTLHAIHDKDRRSAI